MRHVRKAVSDIRNFLVPTSASEGSKMSIFILGYVCILRYYYLP